MALWLDLIPKLHRFDTAGLHSNPSPGWDDISSLETSEKAQTNNLSPTNLPNSTTTSGGGMFYRSTRTWYTTSSNRGVNSRRNLRPTPSSEHTSRTSDAIITPRRPNISLTALQLQNTLTTPLTVTLTVGCAFLSLNMAIFCVALCRQFSLNQRHERRKTQYETAEKENNKPSSNCRPTSDGGGADRTGNVHVIELDESYGEKALTRPPTTSCEPYISCLIESDIDDPFPPSVPSLATVASYVHASLNRASLLPTEIPGGLYATDPRRQNLRVIDLDGGAGGGGGRHTNVQQTNFSTNSFPLRNHNNGPQTDYRAALGLS